MSESIHPETRIGHVHLKVSNLDECEAFYRNALGYEVTIRAEGLVFMSAGGYHHHIALNSTMTGGKERPAEDVPGILHFAILYSGHDQFVAAVRRALEHGAKFHRASDYGYSVAAYTRDPDGREVELGRDRDPSLWWRNEDGSLRRDPQSLTLDEVLARSD